MDREDGAGAKHRHRYIYIYEYVFIFFVGGGTEGSDEQSLGYLRSLHSRERLGAKGYPQVSEHILAFSVHFDDC